VSAGYGERNREQFERLQRLVASLGADGMQRELDGGWTVGDTLLHLAFYDRRAEVLLAQFAREGVSPSPYDYETINTVLLNFSRRMAPEAIAAEVIAAAEAADRAAAATPEAHYEEILTKGQVNLERAEHRRNHLDDLEAALSS
jgi:hypothetical protein